MVDINLFTIYLYRIKTLIMNTENNKIIAEFMGYKKSIANTWFKGNKIVQTTSFKYDSDWNWLMEVVDKIESLKVVVEIRENVCYIETSANNYYSELEDTKLQATYKAVLVFIKWYNEQKI